MRFVVIARDGSDPEAKDRRAAVRPAHLERTAPYVESGQVLLGGAILDETGDMVGSGHADRLPDPRGGRRVAGGRPLRLRRRLAGIEVQPYRPAVGAWFPGE